MISLRRVFSGLAATALIGGTIFLGIKSGQDSRFVVWFGISSAVAAPLGLALLASLFNKSDSEVISRLAKVPEIEKLINEARTQEEKIQLLEEERMNLVEIVRVESARQAALDRIDSLERDATRILDELEFLEQEVATIDRHSEKSYASSEIRRLRERVKARRDSDVILRIGGRSYRIDRDIIKAMPLGESLLAYIRLAESVQAWLSPRSKK